MRPPAGLLQTIERFERPAQGLRVRLEREGLLARNPCPLDGRSNVLAITDKGRKLRAAMWPTYAAAIEAHLGARLTPEEARQLAAILGKLLPAAKTS